MSKKMTKKFVCEMCRFSCEKKSDYVRHCDTKKHLKNCDEPLETKKTRHCLCGRFFNSRGGFWKHKNKCQVYIESMEKQCDISNSEVQKTEKNASVTRDEKSVSIYAKKCPKISKKWKRKKRQTEKEEISDTKKNENDLLSQNLNDLKQMFRSLMANNENLQQKVLEIANQPKIINQNNFNVLNYLNTECKDALNIYEFIDSLPIDIDHCKMIADNGYYEPFQNVFVKALSDMDQKKRPIHCTDIKRKSSYIKNYDNEWVRDINNEQFENALDYLQHKQVCEFRKHKNKDPNWMDNDENLDFFNNFVNNVYLMNSSNNGTGDRLKKKLINSTLAPNKLIRE